MISAKVLIVALTLLGEARGEGFEGMSGVASVIQTRSIERRQTPDAVCLAPKQFSFWNIKHSEEEKARLLASPQGQDALRLARLVCAGTMPDVVNGANHYHAVSVHPKWAKASALVALINHHKFYRL